MTSDGAVAIDTSDEVQASVVITHGGRVVHEGVAALLNPAELNPAELGTAELDSEGDADVNGPAD